MSAINLASIFCLLVLLFPKEGQYHCTPNIHICTYVCQNYNRACSWSPLLIIVSFFPMGRAMWEATAHTLTSVFSPTWTGRKGPADRWERTGWHLRLEWVTGGGSTGWKVGQRRATSRAGQDNMWSRSIWLVGQERVTGSLIGQVKFTSLTRLFDRWDR